MNEQEVTLDSLTTDIERLIRTDGGDAEVGHYEIDLLCMAVIRAVANHLPDAQAMAEALAGLLDIEQAQGWTRWYA